MLFKNIILKTKARNDKAASTAATIKNLKNISIKADNIINNTAAITKNIVSFNVVSKLLKITLLLSESVIIWKTVLQEN